MSQKENKHPYQAGTEHGYISFGEVNTYSNEIDACKLQMDLMEVVIILGCKRLVVRRMVQKDLLM